MAVARRSCGGGRAQIVWKRITFYSKAVRHLRRVYFHPRGGIYVSDTGLTRGRVAVVEVIQLAPLEFALYDARTGKRLQRYPKTVRFPIEGIGPSTNTDAPTVCHSCHHPRTPLIAVVPSTPMIEGLLRSAKARGHGVRASTVLLRPNTRSQRRLVEALNSSLGALYPTRHTDIRVWLRRLE